MWPFKRRPVKTMEQLAAEQPPAPCGKQTTHWQWVLIEGWACPACAANERHAKERAAEKRMAGLIADAVVAKLAEKPIPSQGT